MMKKLVTILAAALLTLGAAANAMAYFDDLSLVRVVYDSSNPAGVEVAYDLGNINSYLASGGTFSAGSSILADFGSVTADKLRVAYFAYDSSTSSMWVSGGDTAPTANIGAFDNVFNSSFMTALGVYQASGTDKAVTTMDNANSYYTWFNQSGNLTGSFAGSFNTNVGEASLADMATGTAQKLYFFAEANNGGTGVMAMNITTNANGSTTLAAEATPTPIPPSFLLMGSGLLGMVGIRRKFAA
jgi:hypothetical protein